jgi:hypothetical protein
MSVMGMEKGVSGIIPRTEIPLTFLPPFPSSFPGAGQSGPEMQGFSKVAVQRTGVTKFSGFLPKAATGARHMFSEFRAALPEMAVS